MAIVTVVLVAYGNWVSSEPSDPLEPVDAVIVHAGGRGERLSHARELMRDDVAPVLVVMRGNAFGWWQANELCSNPDSVRYEVICPTPDPDTTIGEALQLELLVQERGWETVFAVTSDYHSRRATMLDTCIADVEVLASPAEARYSIPIRIQRIVWEMGGMVQAALRC